MSGKNYVTESERKRLGENIKKLLNERGMTQADLARITMLDKSTVNTYVKGRRAPSIGALLRICAALECTAEELTKGVVVDA